MHYLKKIFMKKYPEKGTPLFRVEIFIWRVRIQKNSSLLFFFKNMSSCAGLK